MSSEIMPLDHRYRDYLQDQSGLVGQADTISFPESEKDVCQLVAECAGQGTPITMQGGRTGLCGGAVPAGGHVLNLMKMKRVVSLEECGASRFAIRVQAGLPLMELNRSLESRRMDTTGWDRTAQDALASLCQSRPCFWPPDPTEGAATIGGIAANDSRGPTGYRYGSARKHIRAIRVVDAAGVAWEVQRGRYCFRHGNCLHPNGTLLSLPAVPFDPEAGIDLVDIYLGSEGVLGPMTELTLDLLPLPAERWAILLFFPAEEQAARCIDALRCWHDTPRSPVIAALDFFDKSTLECIERLRKVSRPVAALPVPPPRTNAAIYVELHGEMVEDVEDLATRLLETAVEHQCNPDDTLAFVGDIELSKARLFCHSAVEAIVAGVGRYQDINASRKFIADFGKTGWTFTALLDLYRSSLRRAGLHAAVFGHAGDLRVQVCWLEESSDLHLAWQGLIDEWTGRVDDAGGTIAVGHGMGKLVKGLFGFLPLPERLSILCSLKRQLDPLGTFNPGTVFIEGGGGR